MFFFFGGGGGGGGVMDEMLIHQGKYGAWVQEGDHMPFFRAKGRSFGMLSNIDREIWALDSQTS